MTTSRARVLVAVAAALCGVLCSCAPASVPMQPTVRTDASVLVDAGADEADGGAMPDASAPDAGSTTGRACRGWPTERPLRVLFVGNSQIDTWNLPLMVSSVAASAPAGCPRIVGEAFTGGGANLGNLLTQTDDGGRTLAQRIAGGDYDVVVISESIDLVEHRPPFPEQFFTDARTIVAMTREAGATPVLYASPYVERPEPEVGFRMQADPQIQLAEELGVPVVLAGLAWLRVWEVDPTIDLYHPDRAHPGYHGSYVSSLVTWATITGGDPHGLTDFPDASCWPDPCTAIPERLVGIYQQAAYEQVQDEAP